MTKDKSLSDLTDKDLDRVQGAGDPVPYPDLGGGGGGGSSKVKTVSGGQGSSSSSTGNEAGTSKGVTSSGGSKTNYTAGSSTVKFEGKGASRHLDPTTNNN